MIARALRLTGDIEEARLSAAAHEVTASFGIPADIESLTVANDVRCLEMLTAQRERHEPCGVRLARVAGDEVVLAVVADPQLLDLRSVYLLLGAIMQGYFGRFRVTEYPSYVDAVARIDVSGLVPPARTAWWSRRIDAWSSRTPWRGGKGTGDRRTIEVPFDRWAKLCGIGDHIGNNSSITVVALLAWWLRFRAGRDCAAIFVAELDLRELHGLGTVIGPLTDRIVFEVEAQARMSFHELVRHCHAGLLDAVVHYVPFGVLRGLPGWSGGDVAVHFCRTPPASSATRGEQSLARLGLSVELFCEADLAALGHGAGDARLEVDIAEANDGVALVGRFADLDGNDLLAVIDAVTADPDIPLGRL